MTTTKRSNFGAAIRTTLLLATLMGLFVVIGALIGGPETAFMFLIFGAIFNFGAYWFSDKIAIASAGAKPVSESEAPRLYQMVRDLTTRAGLPMPKLYVIPQEQPNAFATGRNPDHSAVAVTQGILKLLSEDELRGVLAHELGHVRNRDTLIMAIVATIAGAITMIAHLGQFALMFGGGRGRDGEGVNPLAALLTIIVAPIAATIIQLAISRAREYEADATGARISQDPLALASALEKLAAGEAARPLNPPPAMAHLYIVNPFKGGGIQGWFQTHPPIPERVARLRAMSMGASA
jgi:heat shock protein HtpX